VRKKLNRVLNEIDKRSNLRLKEKGWRDSFSFGFHNPKSQEGGKKKKKKPLGTRKRDAYRHLARGSRMNSKCRSRGRKGEDVDLWDGLLKVQGSWIVKEKGYEVLHRKKKLKRAL